MDGVERMLDANINRASEGLRVLEDVARFSLCNEVLTKRLKTMRHNTRKSIAGSGLNLIEYRDADGDVGPAVSKDLGVENKSNLQELVAANFKRAQEALRSIEEGLCVLGKNDVSRNFERNRYLLYSLEKEFNNCLKVVLKQDILKAGIYCLTSEEHSRGRNNIEVVSTMLKAGIKLVQYREKDKTMLEKYRQCIKIREMTAEAGASLIVNDHVDLAKIVCADGVHLGQDDMPVAAVRQLVGNTMVIGVSTHSPEQAAKAVNDGADYIGVGPIYKTYTKKDVCDPVGFGYLDYVVKNVKIPFVAIGGIKIHNLRQVVEHGAKCVALVTEIVGADDMKGTIDSVRKIMKGDM